MPYTQHFGLSRKSPFAYSTDVEKYRKKGEEKREAENNPATDVIEKNNQRSTIMQEPVEKERPGFAISESEEKNLPVNTSDAEYTTQAGIGGVGGAVGKFGLKEGIKYGLKNYVGPLAGKIFGNMAMMLTSGKAYAQTRDGVHDITSGHENQIKYGGIENSPEAKKFFDEQFANFDDQNEFQKDRLMRINKEYNLGYLKDRLIPVKYGTPDEWD